MLYCKHENNKCKWEETVHVQFMNTDPEKVCCCSFRLFITLDQFVAQVRAEVSTALTPDHKEVKAVLTFSLHLCVCVHLSPLSRVSLTPHALSLLFSFSRSLFLPKAKLSDSF